LGATSAGGGSTSAAGCVGERSGVALSAGRSSSFDRFLGSSTWFAPFVAEENWGAVWISPDGAACLQAGTASTRTHSNKRLTASLLTHRAGNGCSGCAGIDGKGADGPVTVVFGNTDGGAADFGIVLLGVSGVTAADFLL